MPRIGKLAHVLPRLMIAGAIALGFGTSSARAQERTEPSITVLLEKAVELPSNQINVRVTRGTMPVGHKTGVHTHKGPGARYVLKGMVEIVEGGEAHTYAAGEVYWESGIAMTAENVGDEEVELLIVELLPVE